MLTLEAIPQPEIKAPRVSVTTTPFVSGSGVYGPWSFSYVVTAVSLTPPEESIASAVANGTGAQLNSNTGTFNTISWTGLTAAMEYRVYKANPVCNGNVPAGAMYGYIGTCTGTIFVDIEIAPDFTQTPPQGTNPFGSGAISSVSVKNPGSGYTSGIAILASDLSGSGASLTPTVSNGVPTTLSVNAAGSGYTSATGLSTTGGSGHGLIVGITASSGAITAATVKGWGYGYAVNDIVTVVKTGASGGTLKITAVSNGAITSVSVTSGGGNYANPSIIPGNLGSGAVATINVDADSQQVTGVNVTSGGRNYFGPVTCAPATSGGGGFTFTPNISNGVITTITPVYLGGDYGGYTDGDSLVFTQASGSGATFSAVVGSAGSYPSCCTYFQQRKVFAGSLNSPQTIWMTQPGNFKNMDISNPSQASDAIVATIASNQVNAIKELIPMNDLVILTSGGVHRMIGGAIYSPVAVTPTNLVVVPQSYIGCADLPPIVVNYDILYVQSKGSIVRDLSYNFFANVYTGNDMSVLANHLFFGHSIVRWAYSEQPFYQIWSVREDGALLSFTYLKEQDVYAWAHHDSPGESGSDSFQSVASITENIGGVNIDSVYLVVQRSIPGVNGGNPVRYVERMDSRMFLTNGAADVTKAWFVDCGLSYDPSDGPATTTVTGIDHLEGATVSILADGSVLPQQTVSDGTITLPVSASTITVGLPYVSQMETLCMEPEGMQTQVQDYRKRISAVAVRVKDTRGLKVGPGFDDLTEIKERGPGTLMGAAIGLTTGDQRVVIDSKYLVDDDVCIEQDNPLPCTVLGVIPEVSIGDSPG